MVGVYKNDVFGVLGYDEDDKLILVIIGCLIWLSVVLGDVIYIGVWYFYCDMGGNDLSVCFVCGEVCEINVCLVDYVVGGKIVVLNSML